MIFKGSNVKLLILLFSLIIGTIYGQSYQEDIYAELGSEAEVLKTEFSDESIYKLLVKIGDRIHIVTLNNDGSITANIASPEEYNNLLAADFADNGSVILITGNNIELNNSGRLIKLDPNLDKIWEREIAAQTDYQIFPYIKFIAGSGIFIIHTNSNGIEILLTSFEENGIPKWQNALETTPSFTRQFSIKDSENNAVLISTINKLYKLDSDGSTIWSINTPQSTYSFDLLTNGKIIFGTRGNLFHISQDSSFIKVCELSQNDRIMNLSVFNDNSIIAASDNYLFLINSEFELAGTKKINTSINDLSVYADKFIAGGTYTTSRDTVASFIAGNKLSWPESSITLTEPAAMNSYPHAYPDWMSISYISDNIDSTVFEFSSDNGASWIEFKEPKEIPFIYSNQCLIRISDYNNRTIYDINHSPFSLLRYKIADYIAANECKMWIENNGSGLYNRKDEGNFLWPGGIGADKIASSTEGVLWGGKVNSEIRVGGTYYGWGLSPGSILENGQADEQLKEEYSLFKLKKDWENLPPGRERDLYQYNYNNWPVQHGAPYKDINMDGLFTRGVDEPKIIGDETLFSISNDLGIQRRTLNTTEPAPFGLEYIQTIFAYNDTELKDVVFKKIMLINRSDNVVEDMFIATLSYDELGFLNDNLAGCDSTLNLGYVYNGDNYDEEEYNGYGDAPPAIGRVVLQGPKVISEGDSARFKGKILQDHKNLPMTSFIPDRSVDPWMISIWGGNPYQFYNNLQGLFYSGEPMINPVTNDTTMFAFSGDPENKRGWIEEEIYKHTRDMLISTGPFDMQPGDTQEVVYAIFMARGSDNLNSVTKLKEKAQELHQFWGNDIPVGVEETTDQIPDQYSLSQNYPNPFNPVTTIQYTLPHNTVISRSKATRNLKDSSTDQVGVRNDKVQVKLIVYDILGREVATLVDVPQIPGKYWVKFNGKNYSSGIYFYRITAGDFSQTNKMILLK